VAEGCRHTAALFDSMFGDGCTAGVDSWARLVKVKYNDSISELAIERCVRGSAVLEESFQEALKFVCALEMV